MALVHFDSYDGYVHQTVPVFSGLGPILSITGMSGDVYFTDAGRYTARCLRVGRSNYWGLFTLKTPLDTIIIGDAFKRISTGSPTYNAGEGSIIRIGEGSTLHVRFHLVGTELVVYNNATLLGTTTGANIVYNSWSYIEVKVKVHDTEGVVVVRVNETEVLSLSNVDTRNGATGVISNFSFGSANPDLFCLHDDLYVCDLTGDAPCNDFLGDVRVDHLLVNGAGTYTQFTPSAGANYQNVDEAGYHDANTTYNETDTVGNKDSYTVESLPTPPAGAVIYGVRNVAVLCKTDVGVRTAKQLLITGATETLGTERTLSDSYQIFSELYELNPADSEPFEDADINAIEPGVEVAS